MLCYVIIITKLSLCLTPRSRWTPELCTAKLGLKNYKHHSVVLCLNIGLLNRLSVGQHCDRQIDGQTEGQTDRIALAATSCVWRRALKLVKKRILLCRLADPTFTSFRRLVTAYCTSQLLQIALWHKQVHWNDILYYLSVRARVFFDVHCSLKLLALCLYVWLHVLIILCAPFLGE